MRAGNRQLRRRITSWFKGFCEALCSCFQGASEIFHSCIRRLDMMAVHTCEVTLQGEENDKASALAFLRSGSACPSEKRPRRPAPTALSAERTTFRMGSSEQKPGRSKPENVTNPYRSCCLWRRETI